VDELEPAAWQALKAPGRASVSAGPGAGKTEFLAQRATYLLQTGLCPAPQKILAISFKRDSAANLSRRVRSRVPEHAARFESMTFDAFAKGLLDRFSTVLPGPWALRDLNYELRYYSTTRQLRAEYAAMTATATPEQLSALYSFAPNRLLPDAVGTWKLPAGTAEAPVDDPVAVAAWCWWRRHYLGNGVPVLNFQMINRLADLLVRHNPQVALALRATYPYVFVDELQDTTTAQFTLLQDLFDHPDVQTTAVGDGKQKIMGWAGARPTAIEEFETTFGAQHFDLEWNFRSSSELVAVQHHVATSLQPGIAAAISKAQVEDGHLPAVVWQFPDGTRQAEYIAGWIAQDIANSSRTAADFALLGKQLVGNFERGMRDALAGHGLTLRNDDADYGDFKLQNLVKHEAARLVVGALRLAVQPRGLPEVWVETVALLTSIRGDDRGERAQRAVADDLQNFVDGLRSWLRGAALSSTPPDLVVQNAAKIVDLDVLEGFVQAQHRGESATSALRALALRMAAVMPGATDWARVVNDIGAQNAVTLQTIHRSKGLEYHTVLVLGLDPRQWWSYEKDPTEAVAAFFVGLSRAAQRVIFTSTDPSARLSAIKGLYALLDGAGVPEVRIV
jgi:superfamily I DNA/RNA helicase